MERTITKLESTLLLVWNTVVVFASALLLYELSLEILKQINPSISSRFSILEFWVCLIFLIDYAVSFYFSLERWRFFRVQLLFLLISIPYHNIFLWYGWPLSEMLLYGFRILLLIRCIVGIGMLIRYATANAVNRILISYTFYLVMIIYFSSISFYYFEKGINTGINSYGDAIWWAYMALTTEGSNIHPVTIEGRIITAILITSGLGLFTLIVAGFASRFGKMKNKAGLTLTDIGLAEDYVEFKKRKEKQRKQKTVKPPKDPSAPQDFISE